MLHIITLPPGCLTMWPLQVLVPHGAGGGPHDQQHDLPGTVQYTVLSTVQYSTVQHSTVTNNTIWQETWAKLPRLVYGGFTNITQFVVPFTTIIIR